MCVYTTHKCHSVPEEPPFHPLHRPPSNCLGLGEIRVSDLVLPLCDIAWIVPRRERKRGGRGRVVWKCFSATFPPFHTNSHLNFKKFLVRVESCQAWMMVLLLNTELEIHSRHTRRAVASTQFTQIYMQLKDMHSCMFKEVY